MSRLKQQLLCIGVISSLAACGSAADSANGGQATSDGAASPSANEPYPIVAKADMPESCDMLSADMARDMLEENVAADPDNSEGFCGYYTTNLIRSPDDKIRLAILHLATRPQHVFSSAGLGSAELKEAVNKLMPGDERFDAIGEYGAGPTFMAVEDGTMTMVVIPRLTVPNGNAQSEIIVVASLDNPNMGTAERRALLHPVATDVATQLRQLAGS